MARILTALLALFATAACGVSHDDPADDVLDPQAAEALAFDPGKADVPGIYQGEIELDVRVDGDLGRRDPYHLYLFEAQGGEAVFIDLASRDGDDTYLLVYRHDGRRWALTASNDDCRNALNSCLEMELESGRYLVLASTWNFLVRRRAVQATYELALFCTGGSCSEPEPVLCGSRGLAPCPEGTYCDWDEANVPACGAADHPGVCRARPEACVEIYRPVCACDGQTYGNACIAASAGVDVSHEGECPRPGQGEGEVCGGIAGFVCADGLFCDMSANLFCGADLAGVCIVDEPRPCTLEYMPVCGCDGRTYGNDCQRRVAGVPLDHRGACGDRGQGEGEQCGGIAGFVCADGLRCDRSAVEGCASDAAGVCIVDEPRACTREYMPVCGCDGRTYGNDCERRVAGVPLDRRGACAE